VNIGWIGNTQKASKAKNMGARKKTITKENEECQKKIIKNSSTRSNLKIRNTVEFFCTEYEHIVSRRKTDSNDQNEKHTILVTQWPVSQFPFS
jgi:hypothetical protein